MILTALRLHQFRLFKQCTIQFAKGINHFIGDNASGKTTILEALYFLSTGKSLRTHFLQEMIQEGFSYFALELQFIRHNIEHALRVIYEPHQAVIYLNDTKISSLSSLLGLLQGVVITTDDVQMIKNGPQERREMLDLFLLSLDPLYHHHIQRYRKAIQQRNALLKLRSTKTIHLFEKQLAKSASYITKQRHQICQQLQLEAAAILQELSFEHDQLTIKYCASIPYFSTLAEMEGQFQEKYQESRQKDLELCTTSVGPHRDDVLFSINSKPARLFASEGQQRTLCNGLKMAQYHLFSRIHEEETYLCIDDLKMSLDPMRLEALFHKLKTYNQVFLTSPERVAASAFGKLFLCKNGQIVVLE